MSTAIAIHREQTLAHLRQRSAMKYGSRSGMQKEAFAFIPALAAGVGHAARWGATRAAPWLARGASTLAKRVAPGMAGKVSRGWGALKRGVGRFGFGGKKLRAARETARAGLKGGGGKSSARLITSKGPDGVKHHGFRDWKSSVAPGPSVPIRNGQPMGRGARRSAANAARRSAKATGQRRAALRDATDAVNRHTQNLNAVGRAGQRFSKWRGRRRQVAAGRRAQLRAAARNSNPTRFAKDKSMDMGFLGFPNARVGEGMTGRAVGSYGGKQYDIANEGAKFFRNMAGAATPAGRVAGLVKGIGGNVAGGAAFSAAMHAMGGGGGQAAKAGAKAGAKAAKKMAPRTSSAAYYSKARDRAVAAL